MVSTRGGEVELPHYCRNRGSRKHWIHQPNLFLCVLSKTSPTSYFIPWRCTEVSVSLPRLSFPHRIRRRKGL
ncbi:hypothetical protein VTL71DRAFT_8867 [Oculimacula yallundae]|uniref:Uncharacterized protein n=1 Tax=Oculimacula yallundae TaxID=86028 RepID=A0ABR4BT51_9HELO